MARALTIISVEKANPSGRRVEIPDGGLQGLYLVIQPSGAKSWAYRYRLNGKTRKYTIGAFPKVDLVNARKLAREAVTAVGEGRDPGVEKKATRHGLSITHNFGPSDGSQFQIRQTRQSSPHHHITWCWIPCSIQVTA